MKHFVNLLRLSILGLLIAILVNIGQVHFEITRNLLNKKAQMVRIHEQQQAVSNALAEAKDWRKTALYYQERLAKLSAANEKLSTDQQIARYELNTFLRVLQSIDYDAYVEVMKVLKEAR